MKETILTVPNPVSDGVPVESDWCFKEVFFALSLANLCLIQSSFSLLFNEDFGYFNKVPISRMVLLTLALNFAGLTIFFAIVAWFVQRTRHSWVKLLAHVALCALLFVPLNFIRLNYVRLTGANLAVFYQNRVVLGVCLILFVAALRWHRNISRVLTGGVSILAPLTFFMLVKMAVALVNPAKLAFPPDKPFAPMLSVPGQPRPRVLWILMDELDQRLAFSARPAEIQLPEMDRLRQQSFYATNAYSPTCSTVSSIPSLTTGQQVSRAAPANASDLNLTVEGTTETVSWSLRPHVFSRARELGVNSGIVGWYHPYTRLFNDSVSFCYWDPLPQFEQSRAFTFQDTWLNQLSTMASPIHQRRLQIQLYYKTLEHSLNLVTNSQMGLMFLHLPGPHRPGIYDASTGKTTLTRFALARGYLDNLILTDQTLGRIRQAMEAAGNWDKTWVLLSSDHCWREAPAYDGKIDYRVPFILKPPGSNGALTYAPAFNTIVSHDLVLALLQREISSEKAIGSWLDQHKISPPPSYLKPED